MGGGYEFRYLSLETRWDAEVDVYAVPLCIVRRYPEIIGRDSGMALGYWEWSRWISHEGERTTALVAMSTRDLGQNPRAPVLCSCVV